jgi:hypothetical protein
MFSRSSLCILSISTRCRWILRSISPCYCCRVRSSSARSWAIFPSMTWRACIDWFTVKPVIFTHIHSFTVNPKRLQKKMQTYDQFFFLKILNNDVDSFMYQHNAYISWIHSFTGPIKLCTQSKVSKAQRGSPPGRRGLATCAEGGRAGRRQCKAQTCEMGSRNLVLSAAHLYICDISGPGHWKWPIYPYSKIKYKI